MARLMKIVLSKRTPTLTPSGRSALMSSSLALARSPTSTALAPRSLRMPKPMEGSPLARATRRRSSRPSSTTATSCRRTGLPVAGGHHQLAEGLQVEGLALRPHVHLALRGLDAAGRHLQVLALDGAGSRPAR